MSSIASRTSREVDCHGRGRTCTATNGRSPEEAIMLEFIGRGSRTCDGVSRRGFLHVGALAVGGLTLPGCCGSRRRGDSTPAREQEGGHPDLAGRRADPHRHVRPEAGRPGRVPRRVQADRHQRARHPDRRAPAAAGEDHGQAGDRPLGLPHQRRPRHGLAVDADRLSADDRSERQHLPVARVGRRQDERAERAGPAGLRQPAADASASARRPTSGRRTTRSRRTTTRTTTASRSAT